MMDETVNSADGNVNVDDGSVDKPQLHASGPTNVEAQVKADCITAETSVESDLVNDGVYRSVFPCSPGFVEKEQPKPLCALLPSAIETCTIYEVNHTFTSASKSHESLKTTSVQSGAGEEDLCATILLACLFCHPLECLLTVGRGCSECVWSLCSYMCGCSPATMRPLLDAAHHCDICGCLGANCFQCDCSICEICLQATECLDLLMEISQMLYH